MMYLVHILRFMVPSIQENSLGKEPFPGKESDHHFNGP